MIKGGVGGGNTITGLRFEEKTDMLELFSATEGYEVCSFPSSCSHRYTQVVAGAAEPRRGSSY